MKPNARRRDRLSRAEKKRFEALAESSPFGLAMIRQDGSFEYTNPMFREMFGYDPSEILTGREWFRKAFPDPDYRHEVIAAWIEDLAAGASDQLRPRIFTVQCKDGTQKTIHFRPVLLPSGEHVVTYEDITLGKRLRRLSVRARRNTETFSKMLIEGIFRSITPPAGFISVNPTLCQDVRLRWPAGDGQRCVPIIDVSPTL